ncbi:MAG: YjjG family noncanonical pyrimidine nucleotidase [Clostridia bacterium]|nr:YjjG family noncanonical pyrimidine nucleotidase [Clostridia bacterium]
MRKYTTLLFDNDNTIMDFTAAEHAALKKAFLELGIKISEEQVKIYSDINENCWKQFERGEITKPDVLRLRFERFVESQKFDLAPSAAAAAYENNLSLEHIVFDGAFNLLEQLKADFDLYLVTNGAEHIQKRRLKESGVENYFLKLFISEQMGTQKPKKEYFDAVLSQINETDKSKVLIIGDSLTSDILGGINAGLDTCLFNPFGKPDSSDGIVPTYVVRNYDDIRKLVYQ